MADIIFVAVLIAFFALSVAFVHVCEGIIGPDQETDAAAHAPRADGVAP